VFPVRPWSKYPALRQWQHRATCNRDQIIRWWAVAPYNIGIACQPAGLVVIDLDAGHSPHQRRGPVWVSPMVATCYASSPIRPGSPIRSTPTPWPPR
jgi:Bifunctional DNA primase/polymerase, N-terminal